MTKKLIIQSRQFLILSITYLQVEQEHNKLDVKNYRCIFLVYVSQVYRLYDLEEEKIVIGRNARFDETKKVYTDIVVNLSRTPASFGGTQETIKLTLKHKRNIVHLTQSLDRALELETTHLVERLRSQYKCTRGFPHALCEHIEQMTSTTFFL